MEYIKYKEIKKYITATREPFFRLAKKYINKNSKILDIGSGDGLFAKVLGRNDIHMLDGNECTVESLKKEFPNVDYGQVPNLPYEDNFFDLIHSSHLIEHLTPQELHTFLKECDRCLKINGYLIISAPTLWDSFYNDMSHLKPYNPIIFEKYLCKGIEEGRTKSIISNKYKVIEKVYRYNMLPYYDNEIFIYSNFINKLLSLYKKFKYNLGFRKLEVSGYTIILKKIDNKENSDE